MTRPQAPNIPLIVSEDHGPHLGCQGYPDVPTPHLDRLAAEEVRFVDHHTACAVRSPEGARVLAVRYPSRVGDVAAAGTERDLTARAGRAQTAELEPDERERV